MVVTPLYAGLLVIWFLVLSVMVVRFRRAGRISLGDGGNQSLLRAIRGHANFAEYVPLALLLMAILETSRFSIYLLHALGITLVVARLLHGCALTFMPHFRFGRTAGAVLTFAVLIVEAVLCLYQSYRGHLVW